MEAAMLAILMLAALAGAGWIYYVGQGIFHNIPRGNADLVFF
jgi:hypothetical protein